MKKLLLLFLVFSLMACNTVDPVEYNDALVTSTDAATRAQDAFANSLGTSGDTMQVNFNKMNAVVDKAIADVKAIKEYEAGKEYKAEVLRYLTLIKNQNNGMGREIMGKVQQITTGSTAPTEAEMEELKKWATDFDNAGKEANEKVIAAQKKFAEKTGMRLEATPSSGPQE